ncbi:phosphatase PAP2 family protein [Humisphaera borealis]|uniref:Phosphatase PAP2 family protein n=1 Tax=Humisphaera borealis TaxID=2807512 RepID=A0A7M2WZF8_9BACT|nr:phosphatase PAP2 family protein [Humisphaera borealis]QOV90241.1 phosphatase PAP2 family protein [Humisphaera borealis]
MSRKTLVILTLWIIAITIALMLDRPVAQWVHDQGWDREPFGLNNKHWFIRLLKAPGEYLVTLCSAILLAWLYVRRNVTRWQAAGLVLGASAISALNSVLKWIAGRKRPVSEIGIEPFSFDLFIGGIGGLIVAEKNLSFPSGHAALAFAWASAVSRLLPGWWPVFFACASATAVERVVENAHYFSDSVVGAAVGCLSTWAVVRLFEVVTRRRAERQGADLRISDPPTLNSRPHA